MNLERMGYKQPSLTQRVNGSDKTLDAKAGHRIIILAISAQNDWTIGTTADPSVASFRGSDGYSDSPLVFPVNTAVYIEGDGFTGTVWYMYDEM